MTRSWISLGIIAFISLFVVRAEADEIQPPRRCLNDSCFSERVEIGGQSVPLLGSGHFRYLVFGVYTAAFYGPREWSRTREFDTSAPSELVIEYHRSVSAKDFAESALELLRRQNTALPPELLTTIDRFHAAYRDVNEGDRYALRFVPGVGTILLLNNRELVQIPGEEFARYYFRIWLDANAPIDKGLRESLFGGSAIS